MKNHRTYVGVVSCLALWISSAAATELVYAPVNPSFGGNPQNAPGLLGLALATNKHRGDSGLGGSILNQSPLDQFNQTLERIVLSQLASTASSKLIGADGRLMPGTFSTTNFTITITDLGGGVLRITTTDKTTGTSTSFEVSQ